MPNVDVEIDATFDKENGPTMLLWTIAKQFSRLASENGQARAELYLEKALENVVKGYLDKFTAELLDDYNGAAKWLGVLESGDPLTGAAQAANDQLGECMKLVEHATNRADALAVEHAATLEKYQSDIDKLSAVIIDHPAVPGGFIEAVVAHIWAMRRGIAQLTVQNVITLSRAAEMTGLTLHQARQWAKSGNMERDADTPRRKGAHRLTSSGIL